MMKNSKKATVTSIVSLLALLLSGCGGAGEETITVDGIYLTGKQAKTTYKAFLGSVPTSLNATLSQSGENVTHLANFTDTLVMNDEYGVLRRSLAKSATHNDDYTVFTFEVRDDVPWVTNAGQIYVDENTGKEQYVSAEDFRTTARIVLNHANNSEIYYMYTLFVSGAWEYYCYTILQERIGKKDIIDGVDYGALKEKYEEQVPVLTKIIKEFSGNEPERTFTATDIEKNIGNGSRLGVQVSGNKVTYTLKQRADFFPTMLTYTPFTPTNKSFYNENKETYGLADPTKILYCGPYLLSELSSTGLKYVQNPYYKDNGARSKMSHIKTVEYSIVDATFGYTQMREAFEKGNVDGFSLNKEDDKEGWRQYITGPDGTGTIQKPYNQSVNSRELDDVSYTYHFVLNPNRSIEEASYKNSTIYGAGENPVTIIENTNRALKLRDVRQLILDGIDLSIYNRRHKAPDYDDQYQMNTFTPRGYVYDETNKDYVDYYYEEYARQKLVPAGLVEKENPTVDDLIEAGKRYVGPQQITGVNATSGNTVPWLNIETLRANAQAAIDAYNANPTFTEEFGAISLPVVIEYNSAGGIDATSAIEDADVVRSWNERANGCTISSKRVSDVLPLCESKDASGKTTYPYFYMKANQVSNQTTFSNITNNGYYTVYTGWGWVGDYADPLTYMHCYVTNGEMSKMSGNNKLELPNFRYNSETHELTKDEKYMFETYNKNVDAANDTHDSNQARYKKFAECEYQLLNDLFIIKPSYMSTQGWAVSVSRAAGYENPNAHYGLADNILTGMWVLKDVPTGEERKTARELQAEKKEEVLSALPNHNTINPIYN